MKRKRTAISLKDDPALSATFSIDSHIAAQARGELLFVKMGNAEHPRVQPGDLLIIEQNGDDHACDDKSLLLIQYRGQHILRQKKFVKVMLRRSEMHIVGGNNASSNSIKVIGRVVGWSLGTFHR